MSEHFQIGMEHIIDLSQAPQAIVETSSRGYATRADWNQHRETITRLYVEDDNTLKTVMQIMAREYGHNATLKMYKSRITKWKLDKKIKESEALAILLIKAQRDLLGKKSAFRLRGKPVTVDDMLRYFKRKGGLTDLERKIQETGAATPLGIESWTPPTTPKSEFPNSLVQYTHASSNVHQSHHFLHSGLGSDLCEERVPANSFSPDLT